MNAEDVYKGFIQMYSQITNKHAINLQEQFYANCNLPDVHMYMTQKLYGNIGPVVNDICLIRISDT